MYLVRAFLEHLYTFSDDTYISTEITLYKYTDHTHYRLIHIELVQQLIIIIKSTLQKRMLTTNYC